MGLGWDIGVYRQTNSGLDPATFEAEHGALLARWQTGIGGLKWLEDLVGEKLAIDLGGDGYPTEFTVKASQIIPVIRAGPTARREPWVVASLDSLGSAWLASPSMDLGVMAACDPDEWLIVQAWDES